MYNVFKKAMIYMVVTLLVMTTFMYYGNNAIFAATSKVDGFANGVFSSVSDPKINYPTHEEEASGAGAFGTEKGNGRI